MRLSFNPKFALEDRLHRYSRNKILHSNKGFNPDKREKISTRFSQSALRRVGPASREADFAIAKSGFKRIIISFVFVFIVSAPICWGQSAALRPQGYVSDFANVLSAPSRQRIETISRRLNQQTGAQIALVTVASVRPDTIEQYAVRLFQAWGIGQKGKDNGALLLIALNDREVRIEVGYGLEGALTDAATRSIIERNIVPAFRQGAYAKGVEEAMDALVGLTAQFYGVEIAGLGHYASEAVDPRLQHQERSLFSDIIMVLMMIGMAILFIRNPRLFFYFMLMSMMGGRRGSGSGGGFGGGFGGFGGGMSGGGGASGRW